MSNNTNAVVLDIPVMSNNTSAVRGDIPFTSNNMSAVRGDIPFMSNTTSAIGENIQLRSGYDIPVYGIEDGSFLLLHIPALVCIVSSFVSAIITLVLSFRLWGFKVFFTKWTKSQRFIVYLAFCDALFNICHFTDHLHIVIVRNMVHPKELCEFYAFNLIMTIAAQNLLVNAVAVNAFMLLYFEKHINFGNKDWKLLIWTFGVPILGAALAGVFGQLGPNGA